MRRTAMTFHRERILILAADAPFVRDVFGGDTHMIIVKRVLQCLGHGIYGDGVAHAGSPTHCRQVIRHPAHRFRAAGYCNIAISQQ